MRNVPLKALTLALSLSVSSMALAGTEFEFVDGAVPTTDRVTVFMNGAGDLLGDAKAVDAATNGQLSKSLAAADFKGKFGKKMHVYGIGNYTSITVIGTGDKTLSMRKVRDLGGYVAMASDDDHSLKVLADDINTDVKNVTAEMATGYALGSYTFDKYKEDRKDIDRTVSFISDDASDSLGTYQSDRAYLVKGVNFARDMGTEPGKTMYPELFAQKVKKMFQGVPNVRVKVLGVPEMEKNNMGALMGVGKGSIHDPRLVVVSYMGDSSGAKPIALVGKGITFDTGGISLKPNSGQWLMKSDLSGAAAVAGAVYAAAKRGENVNLVGVMAMAENMPAEDAIRPGDVLETMSGKTIEVMSTDAEGRLVLSDAVTYVQKEYDPRFLLNIATLTGSAARALGDDYAAVISHDWDMTTKMMKIGKKAGEDVWPLPLNSNHFKAIKSDIADIKSTAGSPGASIGGAVVGTFVDEDRPWIHIDMAGVDWIDKSLPTTPKGHAGWGVRFMDAVVRKMSKAEDK